MLPEEIKTIVYGIDGGNAVLLVETPSFVKRELNLAFSTRAGTRAMEGVALPSALRLVVAVASGNVDDWTGAEARLWKTRWEGFASERQLAYLEREAWRAANRDLKITFLPLHD